VYAVGRTRSVAVGGVPVAASTNVGSGELALQTRSTMSAREIG
jgi:hypothetical protein